MIKITDGRSVTIVNDNNWCVEGDRLTLTPREAKRLADILTVNIFEESEHEDG